MTLRRAGGYVALFALAAAWMSSAAGLIGQPERPARVAVRSRDAATTDAVAFDMQAQAARLRQRLASAPVPQQPVRNPFTFYSRPAAPRPAERNVEPPPTPPPSEPIAAPEPELTLIGVAEEKVGGTVVRTALLAGPGEELLMAKTGQTVLGRYTVAAIGPDAVELRDVATDRVRRLGVR